MASITIPNAGTWGYYYTLSATITFDYSRANDRVNITNVRITCSSSSPYGYDNNEPQWSLTYSGGTITSGAGYNFNYSDKSLSDGWAYVNASQTSLELTFHAFNNGSDHTANTTITFPAAQTPPQGLSVTVDSSTWDSITLSGNMTTWGTRSGPNQIYALAVFGSTATDWSTEPHNEWATDNPGDTLSYTATIDNNSTKQLGGVDIKGISPYRLGMYARNGDGLTSFTIPSSVFYTAPAPLASITKGTISGGNLSVDITGGDSTVNGSALVYTYYRYSTDGGSTWTNWAAIGGATAWTTQTVSIPITGAEEVIVEAYQIAQHPSYRTGGQSETLRVSFSVAPKMYGSVDGFARRVRKLYGPVNGQSKKITKLYASVNGQSKLIYKE